MNEFPVIETKKIFISAGEASGDFYASNLIKNFKKNSPNTKFYGMGGPLMHQAGAKIIVDATSFGIIGAIEILSRLFGIIRAMQLIKHELKHNAYDLVILIDYAGFNLHLAKIAKKLGLKVLYFISPKIWVWHQSRIKKIKKYVDMMAVLFPFEVKLYTAAQVPVTLIQHPLLKIVKPQMEASQARNLFQLNKDAPIIGLFAGSRKGEIKRLLPIMLETAKLLRERYSKIQFILPLASSLSEQDLLPYFKKFDSSNSLAVKVVKNQTYDAANICDAIIAVSGTVTLEITLLGIPMVIIYKLSQLSYSLIKRLIKIHYIGLCNIIADKKIVPELIQKDANPKAISNEIIRLLDDQNYRKQMSTELQNVRKQLDLDAKTKTIEQVAAEMLYEKTNL